MLIISKKIDEILKKRNISHHKLSKIINCDESYLNRMFRGENPFSKTVIKKLLPLFDITEDDFKSWEISSKYPKEIICLALQAKQTTDIQQKKFILTLKIDEILKKKKLSRTAMAKLTGVSQSGLNRMITCKETMSENIMKKLAPVLEISPDNIKAWTIADKYSLTSLSRAVDLL